MCRESRNGIEKTWDQGIGTKDLGLGKSNGGIGGLKPYNKNKNWNRLIKIYFNKNKIININ